jgi:hypothetical protein
MQWVIEVESGVNWSIVCHCGSEEEAGSRARYFRPMQCFSGREIRIRQLREVSFRRARVEWRPSVSQFELALPLVWLSLLAITLMSACVAIGWLLP